MTILPLPILTRLVQFVAKFLLSTLLLSSKNAILKSGICHLKRAYAVFFLKRDKSVRISRVQKFKEAITRSRRVGKANAARIPKQICRVRLFRRLRREKRG